MEDPQQCEDRLGDWAVARRRVYLKQFREENYIFGEFMIKVFAATFLTFGMLCSFPTAQAQAPKGNAHVGEEVFTKRCFQCHSVIEGQVRFGPSLFGVMKGPHPRKTAPEIRTILKEGKNKMPSFKDILTEEDTDNLLAYLHTL